MSTKQPRKPRVKKDPPPTEEPTETPLPPLDGQWWRVMATTPVKIHGLKDTLQIRPGAIFNDAVTHAPNIPGVVEKADLAALIRSPEIRSVGILRPGELGDVLVALVAARWLRKALPHLEAVTLYCHSRFHDIVGCQDEVTISGTHYPMKKSHVLVVDFRHYFELDHVAGNAQIPRLDRVLRTFGFEPPYA